MQPDLEGRQEGGLKEVSRGAEMGTGPRTVSPGEMLHGAGPAWALFIAAAPSDGEASWVPQSAPSLAKGHVRLEDQRPALWQRACSVPGVRGPCERPQGPAGPQAAVQWARPSAWTPRISLCKKPNKHKTTQLRHQNSERGVDTRCQGAASVPEGRPLQGCRCRHVLLCSLGRGLLKHLMYVTSN